MRELTPQQRRGRETRARLLRSGAEALGRVGPAELTVRLVAKQAGVSVGTLYRYFGSKEGLLLSLSRERAAERWDELLQRAREMRRLPIRVALDHWIRCEIAYQSERAVPRYDTKEEGFPGLAPHPETAELRRLLFEHVVKTLDEGSETRIKETGLAARLWIDGLDAIVLRFARQHPNLLRDPRFIEELVDLFQRYLLSPRSAAKNEIPES